MDLCQQLQPTSPACVSMNAARDCTPSNRSWSSYPLERSSQLPCHLAQRALRKPRMERDSQRICGGFSWVLPVQRNRRLCEADICPPAIAGMRTKGCSPRTPDLVSLRDVKDGRRRRAAKAFFQLPGLFVSLLTVDKRQDLDAVFTAPNLAA